MYEYAGSKSAKLGVQKIRENSPFYSLLIMQKENFYRNFAILLA
jgi:hypothetical protein